MQIDTKKYLNKTFNLSSLDKGCLKIFNQMVGKISNYNKNKTI